MDIKDTIVIGILSIISIILQKHRWDFFNIIFMNLGILSIYFVIKVILEKTAI